MFSSKLFLIPLCLGFSLAHAKDSCKTLRVFVTLKKGEGCDAVMGHTGVGIDEDYYDWGPASDKNGTFANYVGAIYGSSGRPYDDENVIPVGQGDRNANSSQIRDFLAGKTPIKEEGYKDIINVCEAYEVTASITERQAAATEYFWNYIYSKKPYFHVLKNQCTNIAYGGLVYAGILQPSGIFPFKKVMLIPGHLLKRMKAQLVNTCGKDIGKPAVFNLIKKTTDAKSYMEMN